MQNRSIEQLSGEKIPRLVLGYSATILVSLLLHAVYTLLDSLFLSWGVGDNAVGGVSIVFPFVLLQGAISTALGGGAASLVSRKIGANRLDEAGNVALNAMLTFWITAVITTILGFTLMSPLLDLMGVTEELRAFSKDYFTIILLGNIFSTGFSSIIRAEGKMRYGLLIWAIPITLNIILDAVFILLLGWGVKGSAYATVACQFTSFSMSILFFTRFTTLEFKGARLNFGVTREILLIGLPTLVQASTSSVSLVLINNVLKFSSGTLAINTYAYLNKILLFAAIPIISLMQSINPIVGYNYGAKNHDRVRQTIRFSILVSIAYAILALIVFEVKPEVFILLFTDNAEIIGLGARAMRIIAISLPFTPLAMLIGSTYQAQGKIGRALLMYAIDIIFMVPCAILMAAKMGLDGVWWSLVVTKILSSGFVALFILTRGKIGSGQRPGHNSP